MNDNTILRIKVPAHLYESVKEQLTINEAKKSGKAFGDWTVVKEKKLPKDGMKKVEEADKVEETNQIQEKEMEKKTRTLDELKAAKEKLEARINEMEMSSKHKVKEAGLVDIGSQIIADPAHAYDILKVGLNMSGHELDSLLSGIGTILGLGTGAVVAGVKDAQNKKAAKSNVPAGSTGNL